LDALCRESADADWDLTVAVMGCAVNGPGEASRADFGAAAGDGEAVLFRKGVVQAKVPESMLVDELIALIESEVIAN
jgi:(E)-4-hydroxy-3-methylbut-2-enyl-diphosphate synthase